MPAEQGATQRFETLQRAERAPQHICHRFEGFAWTACSDADAWNRVVRVMCKRVKRPDRVPGDWQIHAQCSRLTALSSNIASLPCIQSTVQRLCARARPEVPTQMSLIPAALVSLSQW